MNIAEGIPAAMNFLNINNPALQDFIFLKIKIKKAVKDRTFIEGESVLFWHFCRE